MSDALSEESAEIDGGKIFATEGDAREVTELALPAEVHLRPAKSVGLEIGGDIREHLGILVF